MVRTAAVNPADRDLEERSAQRLLWLIVVVAALPCAAGYLPFSDYFGHLGNAGITAHWFDRASDVRNYFTPNARILMPSTFFVMLAMPVTQLVPPLLYTNAVVMVGTAGLVLATARLLVAFGHDRRRALWLAPLVYYRCVWFGFVPFIAAVTLAVWALAEVKRLLDRPPPDRWPWVGLACLFLLTAWTHFFAAMLLATFTLILLLTTPRRARDVGGGTGVLGVLAAGLPGALLLGQWLLRVRKDPGAKKTELTLPKTAKALQGLFDRFVDWNQHGYAPPLERVEKLAFQVTVALFVALAIYALIRRERRARLELGPPLLLLAAVGLFLTLPMSTPAWWAINVRLVPFIWVFLLCAIPPTKTLPRALWMPAALVAVLWNGFLFYDFRFYFNRVDMAGADEIVDALPPGKMVIALWPTFDKEKHYSHFSMAHGMSVYQVRRGGHVSPALSGERENVLLQQRFFPPGPFWGQAAYFSCKDHGKGYDYYVVKQQPPGPGVDRNRVFDGNHPEVRRVATAGLWTAYENLTCGR